MTHRTRSGAVMAAVCAAALAAGCSNKDAGDKPAEPTADKPAGKATEQPAAAPPKPAASPASAAPAGDPGGCGADWADPQKTYCVTVPTGYTAGPPTATPNFHAQKIKFTGPDGSFEIFDDLGETYDKAVAAHDAEVKANTVLESGRTAGTGTWWSYEESGFPRMVAVIASHQGEPIWCHAADNSEDDVEGMPAAAAAACKSLRAYPR